MARGHISRSRSVSTSCTERTRQRVELPVSSDVRIVEPRVRRLECRHPGRICSASSTATSVDSHQSIQGCGPSRRSAGSSAFDGRRCERSCSRRLPSRRGMCSPPAGARSGSVVGLVPSTAYVKIRTLVRWVVASVPRGPEGKGRPAGPRQSMRLQRSRSGYNSFAAAILSGSVQPRKACPPAVHSPGVGPPLQG